MTLWQGGKNAAALEIIKTISGNRRIFKSRCRNYTDMWRSGERKTTWDYQWGFAVYCQSGMTVVPCKNLVTNIGFGHAQTTHTVAVTDAANIPLGTLTFPLRDNTFVFADPQYDKIIEQMRTLTPMVKLKQFLRSHNKKKMLRNFLRRKFGK